MQGTRWPPSQVLPLVAFGGKIASAPVAAAAVVGGKDHEGIFLKIQFFQFIENAVQGPVHRCKAGTEEFYALLGHAAENNCNFLLNVGPMADGSIHPAHEKILLEVGDRIRREGYPSSGESVVHKSAAQAL